MTANFVGWFWFFLLVLWGLFVFLSEKRCFLKGSLSKAGEMKGIFKNN